PVVAATWPAALGRRRPATQLGARRHLRIVVYASENSTMRIATDFRPERLSVRMSRLLLCLVLIATLPVAAAGQGASAQEGATDEDRPTAARPAGDQAESEQTGEAQPLAASDLSTPEARYRWIAETLSGARL